MINILYSDINHGNMVELFYDKKQKNYILIIDGHKIIIHTDDYKIEKC